MRPLFCPGVSSIVRRVSFGKIIMADQLSTITLIIFFYHRWHPKQIVACCGSTCWHIFTCQGRYRSKARYPIREPISSLYYFGSNKAWIKNFLSYCDICKSSYTLNRAWTFFSQLHYNCWIFSSYLRLWIILWLPLSWWTEAFIPPGWLELHRSDLAFGLFPLTG